jgi:hypothetical protein
MWASRTTGSLSSITAQHRSQSMIMTSSSPWGAGPGTGVNVDSVHPFVGNADLTILTGDTRNPDVGSPT